MRFFLRLVVVVLPFVDASADPDLDRTVFRFLPSRNVRFARVHPMLSRLLAFQWYAIARAISPRLSRNVPSVRIR